MTHSYTPAEAALLFIDTKKGNIMNEQLVNETPGVEPNPTLKPSTVIVDGVEYVNADEADAAIAEQLANASQAAEDKDNG